MEVFRKRAGLYKAVYFPYCFDQYSTKPSNSHSYEQNHFTPKLARNSHAMPSYVITGASRGLGVSHLLFQWLNKD